MDQWIWPEKSAQIADFCDKLSGLTDFENAADRGYLAENFGTDSRLFMSESMERGY